VLVRWRSTRRGCGAVAFAAVLGPEVFAGTVTVARRHGGTVREQLRLT
jgi:hypothetical protein